jgi:hypothetical protein
MAVGPLFFLILAAIIFIAVAVGLNAFLLVPAVVLLLGALFWGPILAFAAKATNRQPAGPGSVPTTKESSYEPVTDPRERAEPGR